jgi:hypothetical protein
MSRRALLVALLFTGCTTNGATSDAATQGDVGVDSAGNVDGAQLPDASAGFAIYGGVTDTSGHGILDVEVCAVGVTGVPCTHSIGADGLYRIEPFTPGSEIGLRFTATGRLGIITPIGRNTGESTDYETMFTDAEATALSNAAGATHPHPSTDRGFLLVNVLGMDNVPVSGATVTVSGPGATGPIYIRDGAPDAALTTTGNGPALFVDVTPGEHVVTITHPSRSCTMRTFFWSAGTPNAGRVTVEAGYVSTPSMYCSN